VKVVRGARRKRLTLSKARRARQTISGQIQTPPRRRRAVQALEACLCAGTAAPESLPSTAAARPEQRRSRRDHAIAGIYALAPLLALWAIAVLMVCARKCAE